MILTIAIGIILAFFIIGLFEEIPPRTWYWIWGIVGLLLIYNFWPGFWGDFGHMLQITLVCGLLLGICFLLAFLLEKMFAKRKKGKKTK